MRKPIIAANWKMNMTIAEAKVFFSAFLQEVEGSERAEIAIAPAFTALSAVGELAKSSGKVHLAAQNFYFEKSGAFTGEINAAMLLELGVEYVILGHSERRQIFGETDSLINKKLLAAYAVGLKPILCIGETLAQREAGEEKKVLGEQTRAAFAGVSAEQAAATVVAYEPVWAIGTGLNATPAQAQDAHAFVRSVIEGLYGAEVASAVRIQYGGSVKPANAQEMLSQPDIDGALVGGAALDPKSFAAIVQSA